MPGFKRDALLAVCSLAPALAEGACAWCAAPLPPRRRSWCSDRCGDTFWANHWWSVARRTAKRRDRYRCTRCGAQPPKRPSKSTFSTQPAYLAAMRAWRAAKRTARLEVNHKIPCAGKHGELSCAHHLENLESLCPTCHKQHTAALPPRRGARSVTTATNAEPGSGQPRASTARAAAASCADGAVTSVGSKRRSRIRGV